MSRKRTMQEMLLTYAALELLDTDSSDSEEDDILDVLAIAAIAMAYRQPKVRRYENIFEENLLNYVEFRELIGFSRRQVEVILTMIQNHTVFDRNDSPKYSVFFQLVLTLYRLRSNGVTTSTDIATIFGIEDQQIINQITANVLNSILPLEQKFITWPCEAERHHMCSNSMNELPNCIGHVDSCEIPLAEAPTLNPQDYLSKYSQKYSIKLHASCDLKKKLRYLLIGYPAREVDCVIYNRSALNRNPSNYFSRSQWMSADCGYWNSPTLVTPFQITPNTRAGLKRAGFNKYLNRFHVRIGQCLANLKHKFPSLTRLPIKIHDVESHKFACMWIRVCCILYNVLLPYFDHADLNYPEPVEETGEQSTSPILDFLDKPGKEKRQTVIDDILRCNQNAFEF